MGSCVRVSVRTWIARRPPLEEPDAAEPLPTPASASIQFRLQLRDLRSSCPSINRAKANSPGVNADPAHADYANYEERDVVVQGVS